MTRGTAVLFVFLLVAPLAAADWLQAGGGPGGSNLLQGGGPQWPDIVFRVPAPQGLSWSNVVEPLLIGDILLAASFGDADLTGFYKINTTNGHASLWLPYAEPSAWASDGEVLIFNARPIARDAVGLGTPLPAPLVAVRLDTGQEVWREPMDAFLAAVALDGDDLFLGTSGRYQASQTVQLERRDAATGDLDWSWAPSNQAEAGNLQDPVPFPAPSVYEETWVTVTSDHAILVVGRDTAVERLGLRLGLPRGSHWEGWFVDRDTGTLDSSADASGRFGAGPGHLSPAPSPHRPSRVVADAAILVLKEPQPLAVDGGLMLAQVRRAHEAARDVAPFRLAGVDTGVTSALDGSRAFFATGETLYGMTYDQGQTWSTPAPHGQWFARNSLLADGERVYALTTKDPGDYYDSDGVAAYAAATGAPLWTFTVAGEFQFIGGGDGLLIALTLSEVILLGNSPASPVIVAEVATLYPGEGTEARADLSDSGTGLLGPPTAFRATWGDGQETDWQSDPVLRHRYQALGDFSARFFVRNDGGQTSSVPVTFHVGTRDPAANILSEPFHEDFQETTFFILGLFATGLLALFGIYRAGRKRRLLDHELRHLQALREEYGDDAEGLMDGLVERRQAAHEHYMRRRLEDGHLQLLEKRIDEIAGRARLSRVEDECGFLPYSLARTLEGMLRDGRISSRERTSFLSAIELQPGLTADQKSKVHALVEEWFARDRSPAACPSGTER